MSKQAPATLFLNLFFYAFVYFMRFYSAIKHNNQVNNSDSDNISLFEGLLCARHPFEHVI